ncbi:acetyltransferase [Elysia marginata]|uniref:Acetyltransferase n=1 Tax=Elysia marginata TaxID=1093978 RepID=A0AAV4JQS9_9GAST|nr:acetyltransferase [Elysia marginata]
MKSTTPEQPILITDRLQLRPFRQTDAKRVQQLAGDQRIADVTLNIPYPYQNGMAEAWISSHEAYWRTQCAIIYAITQKQAPEEIIGAISLIDLTPLTAELGYWVGVQYWRQGFCTEADQTIINYGFNTLSLKRIYCHHLVRNPASERVMQKVGMRRISHKTSTICKNGQEEPVLHYEILNPG